MLTNARAGDPDEDRILSIDPITCDLTSCHDLRPGLGHGAGVEVVMIRNPDAAITNLATIPDDLRVLEERNEALLAEVEERRRRELVQRLRVQLREQIWDATIANPNTIMPPFGKHRILTEKEVDLITEFVYSL